jgi:hypothetical protein
MDLLVCLTIILVSDRVVSLTVGPNVDNGSYSSRVVNEVFLLMLFRVVQFYSCHHPPFSF